MAKICSRGDDRGLGTLLRWRVRAPPVAANFDGTKSVDIVGKA